MAENNPSITAQDAERKKANDAKFDAAANKAQAELNAARMKVQMLKAESAPCIAEKEAAEREFQTKHAAADAAGAFGIVNRQEEYEAAKEAKAKSENEVRKAVKVASITSKNLNHAKKKNEEIGFFGYFTFDKQAAQVEEKLSQRDFDRASAKMSTAINERAANNKRFEEAAAAQPSEDEYKKAKVLVDASNEAEQKLADVEAKCSAILAKLKEAEDDLANIGYDDETVKRLQDAVRRGKKKYQGVGAAWVNLSLREKDGDPTVIMDLRNLPNGVNFRAENKSTVKAMENGRREDLAF